MRRGVREIKGLATFLSLQTCEVLFIQCFLSFNSRESPCACFLADLNYLKGQSDEAFYCLPVVRSVSRLWHGGRNDVRYGSGFAEGGRLDAAEIIQSDADLRRIILRWKICVLTCHKNNRPDLAWLSTIWQTA